MFNQAVNGDGSGTTATHSTVTGIYGADYVTADGSFIDYQTLYDGNGGYTQSCRASVGRHGENDLGGDGSTIKQKVNTEGAGPPPRHSTGRGANRADSLKP